MNKNFHFKDDVELSMPLNPVYIGTARTTASSIAEKMNFSNSKVEDIKTAVSETVSLLIKNLDDTTSNSSNFQIRFKPDANDLKVEFNTSLKAPSNAENDSLSLKLIKTCMDDVSINYNNDSTLNITMLKKI